MKKIVIRTFILGLAFCMFFGCVPVPEVSSMSEAESIPVSSKASAVVSTQTSAGSTISQNASSTVSKTQSKVVKPEKSQKQQFSESVTDFGLTMLAQMPRDGQSTVFSPVSLAVPLSLLANGANGTSYDELATVLGIKEIKAYNEQFAAYQKFLNENNEFFSSEEMGNERSYLKYGSSIWVKKDLIFNPVFLSINDLYYSAKLTSLDFNSPTATAQRINEWVREMTENKVQKLVEENDIKCSCMIVINTIFFKYAWAKKYFGFNKGQFIAYDGYTITTDFLYSGELTRYINGTNVSGFKQNYFGNKYYFAALLPDEGIDIYEYAASLNGEDLQRILKNESEHELYIKLPKFDIKNDLNCKDLLQKAGVNGIFRGEINGILEEDLLSHLLFISKIEQDVGIELNENGTTAYAATMMTPAMGGPQYPIKLNFNKPFLYVIADEEYDIPLFIGIVATVKPAANE